MSAYSAAGATLDRKFGDVGSGPGVDNYPGIAAGASGHLYLYTALNLGQILVYKKYGAVLQQTLQYQNKILSALTLDDSGNLYAMARNVKRYGGPLDEFAANRDGTLALKPFVRRPAVSYYIVTDPMGDVGSAGGANGFTAYTKESKSPFWVLNATNTSYTAAAFDGSGDLAIAQQVISVPAEYIYVYARGASTPTYSIMSDTYAPVQLAYDGSGNLYVLDYCTSNCGTNPIDVISIYAPGATIPAKVLEPDPGSKFATIGVSKDGHVAAIEYEGSSQYGMVVYDPGATVPSARTTTGLQAPFQVVFGT
ncbi:MAG TPA: hypothetical protein VGF98_02935 [Candidatus Tumulicola sp.]